MSNLLRDRNRFDTAVRDLPERQAELRSQEAAFNRNLANLGHNWNADQLLAFDTSFVVKDEVNGWKARLDKDEELVQQSRFQLEQHRESLRERERETRDTKDKLPPDPALDAANLTQRLKKLREAGRHLELYERERQNHENLLGQLNVLRATGQATPSTTRRPNLPLLALLALGGIFLIVAGIIVGGGGAVVGVAGGLAMLAAAAALWVMNRPAHGGGLPPVASALEQQAWDAENAASDARRLLLESVAPLGCRPDAPALLGVEEQLRSAQGELDAWTAATTLVEEAARQERRLRERVQQAEQDSEAALSTRQATLRLWRQWLQQRELNEGLTSEGMDTFLIEVESTRQSLGQLDGMRNRVTAIEVDISEFQDLLQPLAKRHGLQIEPEKHQQLAQVADDLIQSLERAKTAASQREIAQTQAEEFRRQLGSRERRAQTAVGELEALLAAAGADDAEHFRRRARQNQERMDLERERDERRRSLLRISGPGQSFDDLCKALSTDDLFQLRETDAQLSDQQAALDVRRNDLREERGGIETNLARLSGEEASSALRIRRNSLLEQLGDHAREWSRLIIAEELLNRTRNKFEEERQPRVILHAQEFFAKVTGGRYGRLYSPLGEQAVTVVDNTGNSRQAHQLSRGTKEQLFLALRFGLIREYNEHAEPLPVVVDEALVNFDPQRARLAAKAFGQLAETNQVLVFTCHPNVADLFADHTDATVLAIGQ